MHWFTGGKSEFTRTGNRHGGLAECPYNVYPTRNGYIAIICVGDVHWRALINLMGRGDLSLDPRFESLKSRVAHMDEVDRLVAAWACQHETASLFAQLMDAHIPSAPVRGLAEVMEDPNMHERGALARIAHPELGSIVVQQSPLRYDGVPNRPLEPSQPLGADTRRVLEERTSLDAATIAAIMTRQEVAER
jgi:CoA:oxalate CoA-transferase